MTKIKNISGQVLPLHTHEFAVDELWTLPEVDRVSWSSNDDVIYAIIDESIQIYDGDTALESVTSQIEELQGTKIKVSTVDEVSSGTLTPTEPLNLHTMCGFCTEFTFTPQSDGEGGFLPKTHDIKVESSTHIFLRLWGVKFRVSDFHREDNVSIQIVDVDGLISPAGTVLLNYATWNVWVEDGTIICPKAPDDASGQILVGLYLRIIYEAKTDTERFVAINWIPTLKDGEEAEE